MALRKVVFGMAAGAISAGMIMGLTAILQPFGSSFESSVTRWKIASLAAFVPTISLIICIARLAAHRFRTPEDIDGSALTTGTEKAKLLQALLQNTLEQHAIALPVYAAWSILVPERYVGVLVPASILFLVGRILFFRGYHRGAPGRAFGFALTFYPTVALLGSLMIIAIKAGTENFR